MRFQLCTAALLILAITAGNAQVASHAPTALKTAPPAQSKALLVTDKPVARVNGAVLSDRDLLREMYSIFPYARQHSGFPKAMETEIRQGALQMIIFEELVYQEALRRKLTIPAALTHRAEADFQKQFSSREQYQAYLNAECKGSEQVLRQKIRRSLLIDALLAVEVQNKSTVTLTAAKAYYEKNPKEFERGETFSIQTISIVPPRNAGQDIQKEARKRAEEVLQKAKATKNYREFGLLAEKSSDDDWHVNMGDRKAMQASQLPPPLVKAARSMKPGQVSGLLQFGPNYTLFRLNAHTPAGKVPFDEVKATLRSNLQKTKVTQLRSELNRRLQKNAKVEVL
jgi:peptidyl-prolyl cis-trans isomerase SurA